MTNIEPWVIARHLAHSSPLRLVRLVAWSAMLVLTLAAAVPQAQVLEKSPSPATNLEPFLVADINTSTQSADPGYLTTADGTLFFFAKDRTHGLELWKSDGTAAGTTLIEDLTPGIKGTWLPERPTVMTAPISTTMIVMTSSSSTSVKAKRRLGHRPLGIGPRMTTTP